MKRLVGRLPRRWQQSIKRFYFARQIRRGAFHSDEPEFFELEDVVAPGDWVIDIGANVGHYTTKLSQLVQSNGRVLAFEPIPFTFELLAANCALSPYKNVTLFNMAASDTTGEAAMTVPKWDDQEGLNYYEAHLSADAGAGDNCWSVLTLRIDSLDIQRRVSYVKIDAEGHEREVIQGMLRLIECHRPMLVVEGHKASSLLESLGYTAEERGDSPNCVWRYLNGGQDERRAVQ